MKDRDSDSGSLSDHSSRDCEKELKTSPDRATALPSEKAPTDSPHTEDLRFCVDSKTDDLPYGAREEKYSKKDMGDITEKVPRIKKWTRETAEWLVPLVETTEESAKARSRLLLKYISPESYEGRTIYKLVTRNLKAEQWFISSPTQEEPTRQVRLTDDDDIDNAKWKAITDGLERFLPAEAALSPERRLVNLKKDPKETWLAFVCRYSSLAEDLSQVTPHRKLQIILTKLPLDIRTILSGYDIQSVSLSDIVGVVKRRTEWAMASSVKDEELSHDFMEVDNVTTTSSPTKWNDQLRATPISVLKKYVGDLAKRDQRFRSFLAFASRSDSRQPRRFRQRNDAERGAGRRIFQCDLEDGEFHDDDIFDELPKEEAEDGEISEEINMLNLTDVADKSATCNVVASSLLYCPTILGEQLTINGLVDTGASVSIASTKVALKAGAKITEGKHRIQCFNQSSIQSAGVAEMTVKIGQTNLIHEFVICNQASHELLLGNDLLKKLECKVNPNKGLLELSRQTAVQCLVVNATSIPSSQSLDESIHQVDREICIQATEKNVIEPVQRDQTIYIPSGRSFAIASKATRVFVLPFKTNQTLHVSDSGRMPIGLMTSSQIWEAGKLLKVTVFNGSNKAILVGSKTALIGILVKDATVVIKPFDGGSNPIRCV